MALAFAIELPRHAITIRPPGTVSMILPVDGLGVGELDVEAPDDEGEGDGEMDVEGDPVGVVEPVGVGVGVGVGEIDGETAPPTALPSTQV